MDVLLRPALMVSVMDVGNRLEGARYRKFQRDPLVDDRIGSEGSRHDNGTMIGATPVSVARSFTKIS
jgi:hypothetical protein